MFVFCFVFFKQKTAYEMRISDWSSDVCSSDLSAQRHGNHHHLRHVPRLARLRRGSRRHGLRDRAADGGDGRCPALAHHAVDGRSVRRGDRKSVVEGTSVSVRVDLGGRRIIKKKKTQTQAGTVSQEKMKQ